MARERDKPKAVEQDETAASLLRRLLVLSPGQHLELRSIARRTWGCLQLQAIRRDLRVVKVELPGAVLLSLRSRTRLNGRSARAGSPLTTMSLDDQAAQLGQAVVRWQRSSRRIVPTWSEVVVLVREMGYRLPWELA